MFVQKMPVALLQEDIHIVVKLSRIGGWNKQSHKKAEFFIAIDYFRNIFNCCVFDYSRLCNAITKFPGLILDVLEMVLHFLCMTVK